LMLVMDKYKEILIQLMQPNFLDTML